MRWRAVQPVITIIGSRILSPTRGVDMSSPVRSLLPGRRGPARRHANVRDAADMIWCRMQYDFEIAPAFAV
jgi:hypothetical protein